MGLDRCGASFICVIGSSFTVSNEPLSSTSTICSGEAWRKSSRVSAFAPGGMRPVTAAVTVFMPAALPMISGFMW